VGRKERKETKDKWKDCGVVDKPTLEQQFFEPFLCEKSGAIVIVLQQAGWQAGRQNTAAVYSAVRGYKEFYNQYKEIWEASYGEKRKNFNPFAASVMKDKEVIVISQYEWVILVIIRVRGEAKDEGNN